MTVVGNPLIGGRAVVTGPVVVEYLTSQDISRNSIGKTQGKHASVSSSSLRTLVFSRTPPLQRSTPLLAKGAYLHIYYRPPLAGGGAGPLCSGPPAENMYINKQGRKMYQ